MTGARRRPRIVALVVALLAGSVVLAAPPREPVHAERMGFPWYRGLTVDAYGGVGAWHSAVPEWPITVTGAPRWPGFRIARGISAAPVPRGVLSSWGVVLDGFGGLHPIGIDRSPPAVSTRGAPYWRGWDIARGVALLPSGRGGFVVDAWGGLHGFGIGAAARPTAHGGPYWPGWDVVRGLAVRADGTGGWVLDAFGGLHPFGINGAAPPTRQPPRSPYWHGRDYARGLALVPDRNGGYTLDFLGVMHAFAPKELHYPMYGPIGPGQCGHGPLACGPDVLRGTTLVGYGLN